MVALVLLGISALNGVCIILFGMPDQQVPRWKARVWSAAIVAYFATPIVQQRSENAFLLLGLATLPLAAGIRTLRDGRTRGFFMLVIAALVAAWGVSLLAFRGFHEVFLPLGPAVRLALLMAAASLAIMAATGWPRPGDSRRDAVDS